MISTQNNEPTVYFDLSEIYFTWRTDYKYYGIARTVVEIGYELNNLNRGVKFAIFSPAHNAFFEVKPKFGAEASNGLLEISFPEGVNPVRLRRRFARANPLRSALMPLARAIVWAINRRKWARIPKETSTRIDMDGQTLISVGRYKIASDYLAMLGPKVKTFNFYPLMYDMIPLHYLSGEYSETLPMNFIMDNDTIIQASKALFSISEFTTRDLHRFADEGILPNPPEIITVPLVHEFRPSNDVVIKQPPQEKCARCVGSQPGRKNLETIFAAWSEVLAQGRTPPKLVLAGAKHKVTVNRLENDFPEIRPHVVFIENPNQNELMELYKHALALIIPSRIEGWGLPLGEALWFGTPGIAARVDALIEVGGDLALYFDPLDATTLAAHVMRLEKDPKFTQALRDRITEAHPQLRRWSDVAREIHDGVKKFSQK